MKIMKNGSFKVTTISIFFKAGILSRRGTKEKI
jgi:hypothetical protein